METLLLWYIAIVATIIIIAGIVSFVGVLKEKKVKTEETVSKLTKLLLDVKLKGDSQTASELADRIYKFLQCNKLLK